MTIKSQFINNRSYIVGIFFFLLFDKKPNFAEHSNEKKHFKQNPQTAKCSPTQRANKQSTCF